MSLTDQIQKDYVKAMKERNSNRSETLNFLRAQIKNVMIDGNMKSISDEEVIHIIRKQVKQREDSIKQFADGGRDDLVQNEQSQLDVLKDYLPQDMTDEELQSLVNEGITELKPQSMKDMGGLMKWMGAKVNGRADNGRISQFVKAALSNL